MSTGVRITLGAALLLTGTSVAIAASNTPVADQSRQTAATTATVASTTNPPVAAQPAQTAAATAAAPSAAAQQPRKAVPKVPDNNDPNGGNDPNSSAGLRAFFVPQY